MMAKLQKQQLERGVICSSAGNHAQGVALAAKRLGCNAVIAMPVTTPEIKVMSCLVLLLLLVFSYDCIFAILILNFWTFYVSSGSLLRD